MEWKAAWPHRILHSKRYRRPKEFKDQVRQNSNSSAFILTSRQNTLLVGAGVSSCDIAREIAGIAGKIYQSSRGSPYDLPLLFLPSEVERIGEVASYDLPSKGQSKPGSVTLKDGRVIKDIERVILCTGYYFSYPFLLDRHEDFTLPQDASDTVLVTDGAQVHNLHKDIFYIPDPTLAFVGVPFYTATFTLFEYQAIVVAAVFSDNAWLPKEDDMREEYQTRVKKKGYGRPFHSLRETQVEYVGELLEWVNGQAEATGVKKVEGYSEQWLEEDKLKMQKIRIMFEVKDAAQRALRDSDEVNKIWGNALTEKITV